ncbi:MAG: hypothetical protein IJ410_08085 [Oscillospiraceae bacterium]|nr:hypothetical protein [Oscillospiraceae bacterium]
MKNLKLAAITLMLIAATVLCVLGMSGNVETGWQETGETDNSVATERKVFRNVNTAIDYPFVKLDETDNEELKTFYGSHIYNSRPLPEKSLSYQQVANIMGESLTILFGLKTQEANPASIQYENIDTEIAYPVSERFFYSYIIEKGDNPADLNNYKVINCLINPYTGEIWSLQTFGNVHNLYDQSIADGSTIPARTDVTKLPSNVHAGIVEAATEFRALMFAEGDIVSSEIISMRVDEARNCYNVLLKLSNGNEMELQLSSVNNADFYLEGVSIRKQADN